MNNKRMRIALALAVVVSAGAAGAASDSAAPAAVDAAREARLTWFREAKFGLFIHWGLYSIPAGRWNGEDYPFIGEWIMRWARIPTAEYNRLAAGFNPRRFDADAVAQLARDAGMRYLVITAKHHDGFAMFDSKASPFNIVGATPYKKDPLKALQAACAPKELRYGFYYSQAQDWQEPNAAGNDWDFNTPRDERQPQEYLKRKALPQVEELLTGYGPLGLFWFDTPTLLTRENVLELEAKVRTRQPACLINSRLGHGLGDYRQMGDNLVPSDVYKGDWEVPATLNDTWGFKFRDRHWKSAANLVYRLVDVVSKGGNYLLNIGPDAEGSVPAESALRLREVGRWMSRHGEAIYGAGPSPFSVNGQAWRATVKPGVLYIHLLRWPAGGRFVLDGLRSPVKGAFLLSDPEHAPLTIDRKGETLVVHLPGDQADPLVSVLALTLDGEPDVAPALRWDADRSPIVLDARDGGTHGPHVRFSELDATASGFAETRDALEWNLLIKKPGRFRVEVEYAAPAGQAGDEVEYRAFDASLKAVLPDTGDTERWATIGTLEVAEAGLAETSLRFTSPKASTSVRVRTLRLTRLE
jgi:alpha-L-fucosidase